MRFGMIAAAAAALACAGQADAAVRYDFTAISAYDGPVGSFSYVSSDFVGPATKINSSDLLACSRSDGIPCSGQQEINDLSGVYTQVAFDIGIGQNLYYFDSLARTTFGTFNTIEFGSEQAGILIVSNVAAAVPEPTSWAMIILGMGAIGFAMRRRNKSVTATVQFA